MIRTKLTAIAIAALALAACGEGDSTGPAPAVETGTITLLNSSNSVVVAVHFSSCEDGSWGENRLAGSETLSPGALRSWTVQPGCYDLRASTGTRSATWLDRDVPPGGALQLAVPAGVDALLGQRTDAAVAATGMKLLESR